MVNDFFNSPGEEFSPIPFWFWNDTLDEEKIHGQIDDMYSKGINAFVIHPRIGIPADTPYLSEKFLHYVKDAVCYASKLGMKVVLYDEAMYPSGSAHGGVVRSNPEFASKGLRVEKSRESKISLGEGEKLICRLSAEGEECLCKIAAAEDKSTLKDGQSYYYLIQCFSGGTIRGIHFGEDDGEENAPKSADLLSAEAVAKFIELTHEKYYASLKEYFGSTVSAFFTDEPGILGRNPKKGLIAWTDGFYDYYIKNGGAPESLLSMWYETDLDDDYNRKNYGRIVGKRLGESFYGQISDWCKNHGVGFTGHPEKSNHIEFMKYFTLPCQDIVWRYIEPGKGIEGLHSTMGKCTSDAARHRGIRRNGNECFGCCGDRENLWYFTLGTMKWYMDWLFVRGVNTLYPHAFFYSTEFPRSEERPPDVGPNSYWWDNYKTVSDYIKRMCGLMTDSVNTAEVAVLCSESNLPFESVKYFYENQIEFNYLECELLPQCCVDGGLLKIEKQRYKYLFIDGCLHISPENRELIKSFEKSGVKVIGERDVSSVKSTVRLYPHSDDLRVSRVFKDGNEYILLVNEGESEIFGRLEADGAAKAEIMDAWRGTKGEFNGVLSLMPRESVILHITAKTAEIPLENWEADGERIELVPWNETERFAKFSGELEYRTDFSVDSDFSSAELVFEQVYEMAEVYVNGCYAGTGFWQPYRFDISKFLKKGKNRICVKVRNSVSGKFTPFYPKSGIVGKAKIELK